MELLKEMLKNFADIFKLRNLITLLLTITLMLLLVGKFAPSQEFVAIFCTAYGSIISHFFDSK